MSQHYDFTSVIRDGEQLLFCRGCGALVCDFAVSVHDKFHERLEALHGPEA